MALKLKKVTPTDYRFLFDLLREREPYQNISHETMPTYKAHCAFNKKKPYTHDFIIWDKKERVGRIYLTNIVKYAWEKLPHVGILISQKHQGKGLGSEALALLLDKYPGPVFANISPANQKSQRFFEKHGFKLIQFTYVRS